MTDFCKYVVHVAAVSLAVLISCQLDRDARTAHEQPRSSKWPAVRAAHLKEHPRCEVCGDDDGLQVHHVIPFHVDPKRELDRDNLITLCTGPTNCHLMFGHLKSYRSWNPDVRKDAAVWREKIKNRPRHEGGGK